MISRIKKLRLVLMVTIILMTSVPQSTYANLDLSQEQINTPSNWAKSEIDKAKEIELVPQRIQGNYRNGITREEFSELAVELYEALTRKEAILEQDNPFVDTENPKVIIANQLGLVQGKGEGVFGPYENITREQVSVVIYSTLQVAKPRYNYSELYEYEFRDYNMISPWARKAVGYLYGIEVINGFDDNMFNPRGYTSREEAIVLVKRMFDKVIASERDSKNSIAVSRSGTSRKESPSNTKLKNLISQQLGKPYRWGATGPNSFDCSGLTYYIFEKMGISIPRTSKDQINAGTYVAKKDLQYGDLVFFARNGKTINHVGIYVGDGMFVHSPETGQVVKTTTLMSGYYANSYYTARRVLK